MRSVALSSIVSEVVGGGATLLQDVTGFKEVTPRYGVRTPTPETQVVLCVVYSFVLPCCRHLSRGLTRQVGSMVVHAKGVAWGCAVQLIFQLICKVTTSAARFGCNPRSSVPLCLIDGDGKRCICVRKPIWEATTCFWYLISLRVQVGFGTS